MDGESQTNPEESVARNRSKRQKIDKSGRLAALQQFKQLKGSKRKYEVDTDFKPVYDLVDEKEYSKHVQQRQEEDWIVDDDGSGYVEDGREFFDDLPETEQSSNSGKKKRGKYKASDVKNKPKAHTNSIKSMFMAGPSLTKPDKEAKLEDDELLGDIMEELNSESPTNIIKKPKTPVVTSRPPVNPFRSADKSVTPSRKKLRRPINPRVMDYDSEIQFVSSESSQPKEEYVIESIPSQDDVKTEIQDDEWDDDITDLDILEAGENKVPDSKRTSKDCVPTISVASSVEKPRFMEWSAPAGCKNETYTAPDINIDSSNLLSNSNSDGSLRFYWLDAYEDTKRIIYLFGKIYVEAKKGYSSCCVRVNNIDRQIFIQPRLTTNDDLHESVTMKDVYNEFNEQVANKLKIETFKSRIVSKKNAFGQIDVQELQSNFLEIQYSASFPFIPTNTSGRTFSQIFGTNTTSLETFLLDRRIKGPCWLEIKNTVLSKSTFSWCKIEVTVNKSSDVEVVKNCNQPAPPLVVMAISMPTVVNPKTMQSEFVAVSCLVHEQFPIDKAPPNPPFQSHYCILAKPTDTIFPYDFSQVLKKQRITKIEKVDSERALLGLFLGRIQHLDPDIIVGHDIIGFDLDVLIHRLEALKVLHWSRIGRLKKNSIPKPNMGNRAQQMDKEITSGRLICDLKISAMELIKLKSYDLTELVEQVLQKKRNDIPSDQIGNMYTSSQSLMMLVQSFMMDVEYALTLMCDLNVIPLALQITNIAGNLMSRTLMGGRSERNEYLLLHAFHANGFICPDKMFKGDRSRFANDDQGTDLKSKEKSGRKKSSYAGGLVLDPKKGFYDTYILLMDFNSLYPSIIQEYNICFTTIPQTNSSGAGEEQIIPNIPDPSLDAGILPTEIRKLVESRREVKKLMQSSTISPELKQQYDIRQKALKLTANSMYGCLGFTHSRFYARHLAALITSRGREILLHTKDLVQSMNLDVIYGDTDSIMINTHSRDMGEVIKLGHKVKGEVNRAYRCLEIDIDGVYKSMLLLNKKKYAALTVQPGSNGQTKTTKELKGLDIVRRDWSEVAKEAGNYVVTEILSDQSRDSIIGNIQSYLINLASNISELPLSKFTVTKQLTKDPGDYPDKKSLSHVLVALRLNLKGGKKIRKGDTVSYIICNDGNTVPATQRAYHADEIKSSDTLKIDFNYYLSQQIHPVVSRLCDPIEGTDSAAIAEFLGLDPNGYKHQYRKDANEHSSEKFDCVSEEDRYVNCETFKFSCPECEEINDIDSAFIQSGSAIRMSLSRCQNLKCSVSPTSFDKMLRNRLMMLIRNHIHRYYQGWLLCEDPSCGNRTRNLPLLFTQSGPICKRCQKANLHPEYTAHELYLQLRYYQYIFDVKKQIEKFGEVKKSVARRESDRYLDSYRFIKQIVDSTLQNSSYSIVNLSKLFQGILDIPK